MLYSWNGIRKGLGMGLAGPISVYLYLSKLIYLHSKGDPDLYLGPIHNNGICSLTLPGILPCVA